MQSITINNRSYDVKPVPGELALVAAIGIDNNLFASYQKHNEFVEALNTQLVNFDPEEIAVKQGDDWVLKLNLEQWFSVVSQLQLIAYSNLLENAAGSATPQETLLGEKRAIENLALVTVQRQKFQEYLEAFDKDWTDKITHSKLAKSPEYYGVLYKYWVKRSKDLEGNCKKFVATQIAQIPSQFKGE